MDAEDCRALDARQKIESILDWMGMVRKVESDSRVWGPNSNPLNTKDTRVLGSKSAIAPPQKYVHRCIHVCVDMFIPWGTY